MIPPRGLTMRKVTDVQLALRQILSDEADPRTMTAVILSEYDVRASDVMRMCDVARDVVVESRRERSTAALPDMASPLDAAVSRANPYGTGPQAGGTQ